MLIDTGRPRPMPAPERGVWYPNVRMWAWIAVGICLAATGVVVMGFAGFVLLLAAVACGCRAVTVALPYAQGLREYRQ